MKGKKKQEGRAPTFKGEGFQVRPGQTIKREYKGKTIEVVVRADGFHYAGKVYTSLSGIATKITDVQTNGLKWFGFRKQEDKPKAKAKHTPKAHRKTKHEARNKKIRSPYKEAETKPAPVAKVWA